MTEKFWIETANSLEYAYEPIVNLNTGQIYGAEAKLRGVENAGFRTIQEFFHTAAREQYLMSVEERLRKKALESYRDGSREDEGWRLFLKLDPRILEMTDYEPGRTKRLLDRLEVAPSDVVFEMDFPGTTTPYPLLATLCVNYTSQGYAVGLDSFGTSAFDFQLLHRVAPGYVKIRRNLMRPAMENERDRAFLEHMIGVAHVAGATVIASEIQAEEEFLFCRQLGCDLGQGSFFFKATKKIAKFPPDFKAVVNRVPKNAEGKMGDEKLIDQRIEYIEPIYINEEISEVFNRFRMHTDRTFFPVVNKNGEAVGIIREKDLKEYVYSSYGRELLLNKASNRKLSNFITSCMTVDIDTSAEKILERFSVNAEENSEGILVSRNFSYVGFLSARSLLGVLNEKRMAKELARHQEENALLTQQSRQMAMGEMVSSIAHQWRQPLNFISLEVSEIITSLALDDVPDKEEIETRAKKIGSHSENLSRIINDFMDFSNPHREKSDFSLFHLMESIITMFQGHFFKAGITFHNEVDRNIYLHTFKNDLQQVLVNLVANARDAFANCKGNEEKWFRIQAFKEKNQVRIEVCDNAGGVSKEHIVRIFEPYFTTKTKGKGTGIGLYLCRQIMEKNLHGAIEVANRDGGACFTLTLPERSGEHA